MVDRVAGERVGAPGELHPLDPALELMRLLENVLPEPPRIRTPPVFSVKGVPPELVPMNFPSIVLFEPPLTSTETSSPLLASSAITLAPTPRSRSRCCRRPRRARPQYRCRAPTTGWRRGRSDCP